METTTHIEQSETATADTAIDPVAYPRRHPQIFTRAEAAAYLGLKSTRSLITVERHFGLVGSIPAGKEKLYHLSDLDIAATKMFGRDLPTTKK